MNNKRRFSLERIGKIVFVCTAIFVIFGSVLLNSYESKLSADIQKVEEQNKRLDASIDGLEIEIANKVDFQYLSQVAITQGYIYQGDQTAMVSLTTGNH